LHHILINISWSPVHKLNSQLVSSQPQTPTPEAYRDNRVFSDTHMSV